MKINVKDFRAPEGEKVNLDKWPIGHSDIFRHCHLMIVFRTKTPPIVGQASSEQFQCRVKKTFKISPMNSKNI